MVGIVCLCQILTCQMFQVSAILHKIVIYNGVNSNSHLPIFNWMSLCMPASNTEICTECTTEFSDNTSLFKHTVVFGNIKLTSRWETWQLCFWWPFIWVISTALISLLLSLQSNVNYTFWFFFKGHSFSTVTEYCILPLKITWHG